MYKFLIKYLNTGVFHVKLVKRNFFKERKKYVMTKNVCPQLKKQTLKICGVILSGSIIIIIFNQ